MAAFDQRFLLSRADTGFAGSLVGKALGLSAKAMQFPADRSLGNNQNGGPDFRVFAP